MFHDKRVWCVQKAESAEDLARWLTEHTMCCCSGFELGGYLFLNDATSADGAQEYAVCKIPADAGQPHFQIESITFGWCDYEKGLQYVRDVLAGRYDEAEYARPVRPRLQTSAEHGRCHFCA
jgi:hypothetical protein